MKPEPEAELELESVKVVRGTKLSSTLPELLELKKELESCEDD